MCAYVRVPGPRRSLDGFHWRGEAQKWRVRMPRARRTVDGWVCAALGSVQARPVAAAARLEISESGHLWARIESVSRICVPLSSCVNRDMKTTSLIQDHVSQHASAGVRRRLAAALSVSCSWRSSALARLLSCWSESERANVTLVSALHVSFIWSRPLKTEPYVCGELRRTLLRDSTCVTRCHAPPRLLLRLPIAYL